MYDFAHNNIYDFGVLTNDTSYNITYNIIDVNYTTDSTIEFIYDYYYITNNITNNKST